MLTGHYGAAQQVAVRETAIHMAKILQVPVLGTPEYFLALDEKYYGDHAAFFETSIMMHLFPDRVDLARLGDEPHQGIHGKDPKKYANPDRRQAHLRRHHQAPLPPRVEHALLGRGTRLRFIAAEQALLDRQLALAQPGRGLWNAWRNIGQGAFNDYPEFLTTGKFEEIAKLVEKL